MYPSISALPQDLKMRCFDAFYSVQQHPTQKKEFLRFLYIYALNPVQHMVLPFATSLFSFLFLCVPRKGTGSESNDQGYHSFVLCYLPTILLEIYKMPDMPVSSHTLCLGHSSCCSHPSLTGSEAVFQRLQVHLFVPLCPQGLFP